jgi:hypothetical protein
LQCSNPLLPFSAPVYNLSNKLNKPFGVDIMIILDSVDAARVGKFEAQNASAIFLLTKANSSHINTFILLPLNASSDVADTIISVPLSNSTDVILYAFTPHLSQGGSSSYIPLILFKISLALLSLLLTIPITLLLLN